MSEKLRSVRDLEVYKLALSKVSNIVAGLYEA